MVEVVWSEGGASKHQARRILRQFAAFCLAREVQTGASLVKSPMVIDAYVAARMLERKATTVHKEIGIIKACIHAAQRKRLIPSELIDWPRVKRPEQTIEVLTADEWRALVNAVTANRVHGPALLFTAFVGCRISDACNLQWAKVDTQTRTALIQQIKTRGHIRIALSAPAWNVVQSQKKRGDYVFCERDGKPFEPVKAGHALRKIALRVLGREVGPKAFRRYLITSLTLDGVPQEEIRRITGHRSDALEAYVRRQVEFSRVAADKFAEKQDLALSK